MQSSGPRLIPRGLTLMKVPAPQCCNYSEYAENRRERLGIKANQPHRIRYKKQVHG